MLNKQGFSLFVFLIYLLLTIILLSCMYLSIVYVIVPSLRSTAITKDLISLHLVSDIFVREVRSSSIKKWKMTEPHCIVWNNGTEDISWQYRDNKLERIQGHIKNGEWKKKTMGVVGTKLGSVTFSFAKHKKNIIGITMQITSMHSQHKIIDTYVAIRE